MTTIVHVNMTYSYVLKGDYRYLHGTYVTPNSEKDPKELELLYIINNNIRVDSLPMDVIGLQYDDEVFIINVKV